jgi:hypothetical protein
MVVVCVDQWVNIWAFRPTYIDYMPSMDLVVAVAAKMTRNSTDRVELLRRCILPAVKDT